MSTVVAGPRFSSRSCHGSGRGVEGRGSTVVIAGQPSAGPLSLGRLPLGSGGRLDLRLSRSVTPPAEPSSLRRVIGSRDIAP